MKKLPARSPWCTARWSWSTRFGAHPVVLTGSHNLGPQGQRHERREPVDHPRRAGPRRATRRTSWPSTTSTDGAFAGRCSQWPKRWKGLQDTERGSTLPARRQRQAGVKSTSGSEPNSIPALNYVLILGVEEIVTMTSMLLPLNDLGAIEHNGAVTFRLVASVGLRRPTAMSSALRSSTRHDQFSQRDRAAGIPHDAQRAAALR